MDAKTKASYLADLDFFQSKAEETETDLSLPISFINLNLGEYAEVISQSTRSLVENPFYTSLQVLMAEALLNTGRKDEARETLFDIIGVNEDNYKALKLMATIYKSEEDKENSLKYLRAAHLRAPEDTEVYGWIEELGGLEQLADKKVKEEKEADDELFEDDEGPKFNIDGILENADIALTDLMRDMSEYKQAGKTLDHMISDHAAQRKAEIEAAKQAGTIAEPELQAQAEEPAAVAEAAGTPAPEAAAQEPVMPDLAHPVISEQELSDDQILQALAAAKIAPEDERTAPKERVDIDSMFAAAATAAAAAAAATKQASQILAEHEALSQQLEDMPPPVDVEIPPVEDPDSPEIAPLLKVETPILDSLKDELTRIAEIEAKNFIEAIGGIEPPKTQEPEPEPTIHKVESLDEIPGMADLPEIPPIAELTAIPAEPQDPTGNIIEDLEAAAADFMNSLRSDSAEAPPPLPPKPPMPAPELIDPTAELAKELAAISRGEETEEETPLHEEANIDIGNLAAAAPAEHHAIEINALPSTFEFPEDLEDEHIDLTPEEVGETAPSEIEGFEEIQEVAMPQIDTPQELEEAQGVEETPERFIPSDLVESVFKEAGVDMNEVFGEDSEPIERKK